MPPISEFALLLSKRASYCARYLSKLAHAQTTTTTTTNKTLVTTTIKRPPVVTIMGHVDHGKTTLLDYLRKSHIVKQEFGGITQHIGAFVVPFEQQKTTGGVNKRETELLTFLDTPGHAAFASMRQRGANITDIVVLVVACEDGVLDQTIESIKFAKNSEVPIIVAINKIDKYPDSEELIRNIELVRKQLIVHDVVSEDDGGDVQLVKISALKGIGIEDLKEAILALAETLELKAKLDCYVRGTVIESSIDPHRGKLCTILVQEGQLKKGDVLISGNNWAKVRALFDERGQLKQSCGPGLPIQVTGWREKDLPSAGDSIVQVENQDVAKNLIKNLLNEKLEKKALDDAKIASEKSEDYRKLYKEKLAEKRESGYKYRRIYFTERGHRPKESDTDIESNSGRKLNLILKCDVDGSLDALLDLLDTYDKDNKQLVKLDLMHYGVGAISHNDLLLASSFPNSVIYGFNVKTTDQKILLEARQQKVDIKLFNVIYHLIDDLKARLSDRMPELEQEIEIGRASVMQEFVVKETNKKKTHVAGCRCSRGSLKRGSLYRLLRNKMLIAEDMRIKTLKHMKDEINEVAKDLECGICFLGNENLEFKPGDLLIAYEKSKYKPKLKWDLKGFH